MPGEIGIDYVGYKISQKMSRSDIRGEKKQNIQIFECVFVVDKNSMVSNQFWHIDISDIHSVEYIPQNLEIFQFNASYRWSMFVWNFY